MVLNFIILERKLIFMTIPIMPFREAVRIFLRYDQQVLSSHDFCPENIYQSQLGHGPVSIHAVPDDLHILVRIINDILDDNDIAGDLETVCTDRRFPRLSANIHEMRTMADILTPDLIQNFKIKIRQLGTQAQLNQILSQCSPIFIGDLFNELSRRHISLPLNVEQFYRALYSLTSYIHRVYDGTQGNFDDLIRKRYFR